MGVAVLNNCIYAIGGIGDDRGEINVPLKTVEKYSFARNSQWSLIAPLSAPRAGMAACVWQGKILQLAVKLQTVSTVALQKRLILTLENGV